MGVWLVDRLLPGLCASLFAAALLGVKMHFEGRARHVQSMAQAARHHGQVRDQIAAAVAQVSEGAGSNPAESGFGVEPEDQRVVPPSAAGKPGRM